MRAIAPREIGGSEISDDPGLGQIRAAQVGGLDDGREQARALEIGTLEMSPSEDGTVEVGSGQIGAGEHRVGQVAGEKIRAGHLGVGEAGARQICLLEIEPGEIEAAEIDIREIRCTAGVLRQSSLEAVEIEPNRWRVGRNRGRHLHRVRSAADGRRRERQQSADQDVGVEHHPAGFTAGLPGAILASLLAFT